MIILFSNCGFAIIAFLFYLCGSNRVAEVFARSEERRVGKEC